MSLVIDVATPCMRKVIEETKSITVIKSTFCTLKKCFVAALGNDRTSWGITLLL